MPTNGMTIDSLNTVSALTAQDEVPVWDKEASGEPTKKITAQNMTNSVKTLGSLVNTTEMNAAIEQSTASTVVTNNVVQEDEGYTFTEQRFSKIGNLVQLHLRISATNAITDRVRVCVINQDYRPNRTIRGIAAAAASYDYALNSAANFYILSNGSVTIDIINGLTAPKEINIEAMWII